MFGIWLILLQIISLIFSASNTVFDAQTDELHQVSVRTASGVRPTIGWTILPNGKISLSIAIKSTSFQWLGIGIPSSSGLGSSLMYGGKFGGAAVIFKKANTLGNTLKEYSMLGPVSSAVTEFKTDVALASEAQKCVTTFCVQEATRCFSQLLCSNALKCGQEKFAESSANATTQSIATNLAFIQECAAPLADPANKDASAALSALLEATSCFVDSCSSKLIAQGLQRANLNTSISTAANSFTSDGSISHLKFLLDQKRIGGIDFNPSNLQTFLVAFSDDTSVTNAETLNAHSPLERAFVTVNLQTGAIQGIPSPDFLLAHVALSLIGFGFLLPLSVALRPFNLKKYGWLPFICIFLSICFATGGAVLVQTLGEPVDVNDPHRILAIVTFAAVILLLAFGMFYPTENKLSDSKAWEKVVLIGIKEKEFSADAEGDNKVLFLLLYRSLEIVTLAIISACMFTGFFAVTESTVEAPSGLIIAPIVGTALCCASVVVVFLRPFFVKCCSSRKSKRTDEQMAESVASQGTPGVNSPNPGFKSPGDVDSVEENVLPLFLSWEMVGFHVKPHRVGAPMKMILERASGICAPRTLTAVLGPSGAGKSSLMEILSLRSKAVLSDDSRVFVNGIPAHHFPAVHRLMGFVPQNDVLHQHLNVLETLQFTCQMILPSEMTDQSKVERMLRVVAQLGLGHVLETKVGGDNVRGLSGGERRRVSIALQLLKSPSILFLDEPTSGLDAHLALRLVKVLRELANEGRTIFATIHQPSAACFELFDRVVLLSGGYTVFSGTRTGCLQFMRDNGRPVPSNWNPADWLLTVVDFERDERIVQNKEGKATYIQDKKTEEYLRRKGITSLNTSLQVATNSSAMNLDVAELRESIQNYYSRVNPSKLTSNAVEEIVTFAIRRGIDALEAKLLAKYGASILPFLKRETINLEPCSKEDLISMIKNFSTSSYYHELNGKIHRVKEDARSSLAKLPPGMNASFFIERLALDGQKDKEEEEEEEDRDRYAQTFMNQTRLLAFRSIRLTWRNPQAIRFQAAQNILFGILLGALYSDLRILRGNPFQQSIAMAIILAMVAFVTLSLGTQVAFTDRLVLEREMSDSMYSPIAYFIASLAVGIPVASIVSLCLILPSYFWIGFKSDGDSFFFFCLVNVSIVFLFDSVVFALTLFVNNVNTAYAIGNFYEAFTIFFSGVFLPVFAIPVYLRWLYFLSPFSYAFAAVVINEFSNTPNDFVIGATGILFVRDQWINLIILFFMGVAWRSIGLYGIIRLFNKKRPGGNRKHNHNKEEKKKGLIGHFRPNHDINV